MYYVIIAHARPIVQNFVQKFDFLLPAGHLKTAWYQKKAYRDSTDALSRGGRTVTTLTISLTTNDFVYNPKLFHCLFQYYLQQVKRGKNMAKEASFLNIPRFYCLQGN